MSVLVRPAGPADAGFLTEMLVEAGFWRPEGPRGHVADVLAEPDLARYVESWPQLGDIGMIAEAEHPIGAAWLRFFSAEDPGYGFVDADTPELAMGVVAAWRGRGVGTGLLNALISTARATGTAALSLSVEPDNPARRLYERCGFHQVGEVGGSLTMLCRL